MTVSRDRYVDVFKLPLVPQTFGGVVIARAAYPLVTLPLLVAVQAATGSVAAAGLAVGAYGASAAVFGPLRARLVDRNGRRRVLLILAGMFAAMLVALSCGAFLGFPGGVMIVLAAITGAVLPPLGPTMRVVWAELVDGPNLMRKALSLDSVVEEILYLGGPAVAGLALAATSAGAVLLVPAALMILGTALFAASPVNRPSNVVSPETVSDSMTLDRSKLLSNRRFVSLLLTVGAAGLIAGNLTVVIPTMVLHDGPALAGLALGAFALGSAVGGLVFGAVHLAGAPRRQATFIAIGLALASMSLVTAGSVWWVVAAALGTGLFVSPVVIVSYFAARDFGGASRRTETATWINVSLNAGGAAGSSAAGLVVESHGAGTSALLIACAALAVLIGAAILGSGKADSSDPSSRS